MWGKKGHFLGEESRTQGEGEKKTLSWVKSGGVSLYLLKEKSSQNCECENIIDC